MAASSDNDKDPIDDVVLAAMKVLDDQVPSGYFDGLPNRTLARLEGSMQTSSGSSGTDRSTASQPTSIAAGPVAEAAPQKDRDEDSGLHDIRNLASSARMRISSRRIGTNPPPVDEDVLASTSGSWKSIALPEPAKMVSLPDVADLPTKAELKAREKAEKAAAKAAEKASRSSRSSGQISATDLPLAAAPTTGPTPKASSPSISSGASGAGLAVAASSEPVAPPMHVDLEQPAAPSFAKGTDKGATSDLAIGTAKGATAAPAMMIGSGFGSRITASKKSNKGLLLGTLGLGLAAAAGVVVYTQVGNKSDNNTAVAPAAEHEMAVKASPAPTVQAIASDKADDAKAAAGSAAAEAKAEDAKPEEPAAVPPVDAPKPAKGQATKKPGKPEPKKIIEVQDPGNGVAPKKEEPKKPDPKETKKDGEPDLNDLLKEGGYVAPKKDDAPKLEKKSLNGADFKNGMNAISSKAQACYKGTQGTASVRLTIAPNGQVSKVSVTGAFAGKPEGACVEAAVRGAVFPPWDGGPQSFNYSYLLAE